MTALPQAPERDVAQAPEDQWDHHGDGHHPPGSEEGGDAAAASRAEPVVGTTETAEGEVTDGQGE